MRTFKIVAAQDAVGTSRKEPRLFVAVDYYFRSDLLHPEDTNILLTADAADQAEFDGMIDELIAELVELKGDAQFQFKLLSSD